MNLEEILLKEEQPQNSLVRSIEHKVMIHKVFIDEEIGESKQYRDLLFMLSNSGEDDEFHFIINSFGGNLNSAMAIVEGMKSTDSVVKTMIIGEAHSAASIIALNGHEVFVSDAAYMMVHAAQYGNWGHAQNVKRHTEFSTKHIEKIIDITYQGFLTEEELKELKSGMEFWFDSTEIGRRLLQKVEYLKKKTMPKKTITKT